MERVQQSCKSTTSRLSLKSKKPKDQRVKIFRLEDKSTVTSYDISPRVCQKARDRSETYWERFLWSCELFGHQTEHYAFWRGKEASHQKALEGLKILFRSMMIRQTSNFVFYRRWQGNNLVHREGDFHTMHFLILLPRVDVFLHFKWALRLCRNAEPSVIHQCPGSSPFLKTCTNQIPCITQKKMVRNNGLFTVIFHHWHSEQQAIDAKKTGQEGSTSKWQWRPESRRTGSSRVRMIEWTMSF